MGARNKDPREENIFHEVTSNRFACHCHKVPCKSFACHKVSRKDNPQKEDGPQGSRGGESLLRRVFIPQSFQEGDGLPKSSKEEEQPEQGPQEGECKP